MSFRKEKKFRLTISDFNAVKNVLHENGMNQLFEPRTINSLYYDTQSLDMFENSEEGVLPRKKIRVRWYDAMANANVETKVSSIEGRFKTTRSLPLDAPTDFPKVMDDLYYGPLTPSLLISYQREYFSLEDMRVTFDSSITYQDYRVRSALKFEDAERVMEIKVGIDTPDDFIESLVPYATSRFSKYSRGLLLSHGAL